MVRFASASSIACLLIGIFALLRVHPGFAAAGDINLQATTATQADNAGKRVEQLNELIHKDTTDQLDVPPVYKRPLGVDAGERVFVRKFIVTGVIDHAEVGVTQASIDALVEKLRLEIQQLDAMNEHGLTQQDLDALGQQMKNTLYMNEADRLAAQEDFLRQLQRDKKYREEMSIGEMQNVANRVTEFYRAHGAIVAQAYVPEQEVKDGVVEIRVTEGTLGKIEVTDNKLYSSDKIRERFNQLVGHTLEKQSLETALLSLGDYPGLTAYGVLQPGTRPGESNLVIKVQDEQASSYTLRAENYGSKVTGEYRATLTYALYNLADNADELKFNLLQAFSPANTLYGDIAYQANISNSDYLYGMNIASNAFDIGGDLTAANVGGTVTSENLFISNQFVRSRTTNLYGRLNFFHKVAATTIGGATFKKDTIAALAIESGFDALDTKSQSINQGSLKLTQGFAGLLGALDEEDALIVSRIGGSGEAATGDFLKLNWDLARLQLINKHQNLLYRFNGQWSRDLLVAVEQFGLGGPANMRGFEVSEYLLDSAGYASVDWNFNAPGFYDASAFDNWKWGEILQFSLFAEYAAGRLNDPTPNVRQDVSLADVGVAAQLLLPGKFQLRFDVARPVKDPTEANAVQFYFTVSYSN